MAGPAAAAGAAKAAGAAGGGSTAGGSSAGGAAGAKAAGGNAAKYQGVSRAIEAGSKEQSREEQQDEQAFNLSNPPNVGADLTSSLKLLIFGGGVFIFLVLIIPMMWLNAAQSQCLFNPENAYGATTGSLGGVKGTGVTREELKLIRSHIYAGNKVTEGTYSATVYGQPWDALAGTPDTSTSPSTVIASLSARLAQTSSYSENAWYTEATS